MAVCRKIPVLSIDLRTESGVGLARLRSASARRCGEAVARGEN